MISRKKFITIFAPLLLLVQLAIAIPSPAYAQNRLPSNFDNTKDKCKPSILGIQGWQKYLTFEPGYPQCSLKIAGNDANRLGFIWLIVAGLLDAGMRIASLIAVGFFLFGGFKLITSQGNPEHVKAGKETMKNAIIGLVICIVGVAVQSIIMGILGV